MPARLVSSHGWRQPKPTVWKVFWAHLEPSCRIELSRPKTLVGELLSLPGTSSIVWCGSPRQWVWQLCCNCPPCRDQAPTNTVMSSDNAANLPLLTKRATLSLPLGSAKVGRAQGNSRSNATRTACDAVGIVEHVGVCLRTPPSTELPWIWASGHTVDSTAGIQRRREFRHVRLRFLQSIVELCKLVPKRLLEQREAVSSV